MAKILKFQMYRMQIKCGPMLKIETTRKIEVDRLEFSFKHLLIENIFCVVLSACRIYRNQTWQ